MQAQVVKQVDQWLKAGLKPAHIQKIVRESSLKLSITTRRVLYNKTYGGFGFSHEFMHAHGIREGDDLEAERTSEKAFETIERLGHDICATSPHLCEEIELCQRLNLQKLGQHIHKQRFRERHCSPRDADEKMSYEADIQQCLEKMQDWPEDIVHAARAYYDTEGAQYWSLFVSGGGPFSYDSDCTFSEHVKSIKIAWPLHEAFRVSGIAGGCLIAAALRKKSLPSESQSVMAEEMGQSPSPQLLLGLAAASGSCCALGYADVPELVDYKIHEYDGKESVVW